MIEWLFILVLGMKTTISLVDIYQCNIYDRFRYLDTYVVLRQDVPKNVDFTFVESELVNAVTVKSILNSTLCIILTNKLLQVLEFDRDFLLFIIYHEIAHTVIGKISIEYPIYRNVFDHYIEILCDLLAVKMLVDYKISINLKKLPMLFDIIDVPASVTHPSSRNRKMIVEAFIAYVTRSKSK